jgi:hypothetical protein
MPFSAAIFIYDEVRKQRQSLTFNGTAEKDRSLGDSL